MSRNPKNDTGITLMPDESNIYVWKGLLQVSRTHAPACCLLRDVGGRGLEVAGSQEATQGCGQQPIAGPATEAGLLHLWHWSTVTARLPQYQQWSPLTSAAMACRARQAPPSSQAPLSWRSASPRPTPWRRPAFGTPPRFSTPTSTSRCGQLRLCGWLVGLGASTLCTGLVLCYSVCTCLPGRRTPACLAAGLTAVHTHQARMRRRRACWGGTAWLLPGSWHEPEAPN